MYKFYLNIEKKTTSQMLNVACFGQFLPYFDIVS
jgi:hypothetical protein